MFKIFLLTFLLAFTYALVPSLPTDQLIFNTEKQDSNNQITVTPIDKETYQLDWTQKKESKSKSAPKVVLKYESFDVSVALSRYLYTCGMDCEYHFSVMILTQNSDLKNYEMNCTANYGDQEYQLETKGHFFDFEYHGFSFRAERAEEKDFSASCKLKVNLP